jgi:hypothetical protein
MSPSVSLRAPYLTNGVVLTRDITNSIDLSTMNFEAPIFGLVFIAPVTLFLLALPFTAFRALRSADDHAWPAWALAVASGVGGVCTLLLLSSIPGITMRYTADFVPGLALGGSIACMLVISRLDASRLRPSALRPGAARLRQAFARGLSLVVTAATVPVVLAGLALGLMAWRLIFPAAVQSAYAATDDLLARAYSTVPCVNPGWRSTDGRSLDAERLVFTLQRDCLPLPGRPALILRSVTVSSALAQSTPMILEANGRRVASERIYPGLQTLLLDEAVEPGPAGQMQLQFVLPERPAEPAGVPLAITVPGASGQPELKLADSYRGELQRWSIDVERRRGEVQQAQIALERERGAFEQLRVKLDAEGQLGSPDGTQRLQAQEQVVLERERSLQVMIDELRPELDRVDAELERIRAKQAVVDAATQP